MALTWRVWALTLALAASAVSRLRADEALGVDAGDRSAADVARRAQALVQAKGFEITLGTLEDQINKQPLALRARYLAPAEQKAMLDSLLRLELLAREASTRGMGENAAVRQTVKDGAVQSLIRAEIDEKISADSISQPDIAAFYAEHPDDFHHPAQRRASHIAVASEAQASALIEEAKKTDLRGFGELARKHSLDAETKLRGGDLAFFSLETRGDASLRKVAEALRKAVFQLEAVGDISPKPVSVDGQFSVIRLTGERPERHVTLAEAEPSIRSRLWRERRQAAVTALIDRLRAQQKPQVFAERVDWVKFDDMERRPSGFSPDPPLRRTPTQAGQPVRVPAKGGQDAK